MTYVANSILDTVYSIAEESHRVFGTWDRNGSIADFGTGSNDVICAGEDEWRWLRFAGRGTSSTCSRWIFDTLPSSGRWWVVWEIRTSTIGILHALPSTLGCVVYWCCDGCDGHGQGSTSGGCELHVECV